MPRVHLNASDPTTGLPHTYEGVHLEDLLPFRILDSESAVIEVTFASHHTITLPGDALDADVRPIIADTVDGKPVTGYVPYYFLARTRKEILVNKNVKLIAIK